MNSPFAAFRIVLVLRVLAKNLGSLVLGCCFAALMGWTTASIADEPAQQYPFPKAPRSIIEQLGTLRLGQPASIGDQEWRVLEAAWNLRDAAKVEWTTSENQELVINAMFVASGVTNEKDLKVYREKLAKVVDSARAAVKKSPQGAHPGETLMKFLHEGVLKGGYDEDQTSLAAVFDCQKHNCVSSTAMYYLVGSQLGFELRVIVIPGTRFSSGHACLDLIDGQKVYEVEPTNPDGFDMATKLNRPGVFVIGPRIDRKEGHLVNGLGLAASIYSNRGVAMVKVKEPAEPDYLTAISLGGRALMCDAHERTASTNVVAWYANWGNQLSKAGRYDDAVRVLAQGMQATNADDLKHNFQVIAFEQFDMLVKSKKDREAQAALDFAMSTLPLADDLRHSRPWMRNANRVYESEGGEAGVAVVQRALAVAPAADHPELKKHQTQLFLRWSQKGLEQGDLAGALKILARAYEADSTNDDLRRGLAYYVQESLEKLAEAGDNVPAAATHFRTVVAQFPQEKVVGEVGSAHAMRVLNRLCEDGKFEKALAAIPGYVMIVGAGEGSDRLTELVYGSWANQLRSRKQWTAAIEMSLAGLKLVPKSDRLLRAAVKTVDDWADPAISAKDWDGAIKIYDRGLVYLPDNGHLKNNRDYCVGKKAEQSPNR
ncbi:MAG: hypothetical protein U1A77_02560 [Pirellulales bacterium]